MKKFFYLLALPLIALMASCSDDNKVPDVEIYATFDGGQQVGDVYYVVQGDTLTVESVNMINNGKESASLGGVRYFWDYMPVGNVIVQPYTISFDTQTMAVGNHLLQAEMPIYAVGYPICTGYITKRITIVAEKADVPSAPATGNPTEQAILQTGGNNAK